MVLWIANTQFESEFEEENRTLSLVESLESNPIVLQLQFLPLIFTSSSDVCVVTSLPEEGCLKEISKLAGKPPDIALFEDSFDKNSEISSWGHSNQIKRWASSKNLTYQVPNYESVKKANSKAFSFEISPTFNNAKLLKNIESLNSLLSEEVLPWVFKTCFGLSGRGHYILTERNPEAERLLHAFCQKQWTKGLPILAEPWVGRILDFSTQWEIGPGGKIQFLGAVRFKSDHRGIYEGTYTGPENIIFMGFEKFLSEHKLRAEIALKKLWEIGYWGPVGIDAMVYESKNGNPILVPIVEINARRTMSQVALMIQQRSFPGQCFKMSYSTKQDRAGLLPNYCLLRNGKRINFKKQLYIDLGH